MIKLIIGQNASGKTLYLNNLIQSRLEKTGKIDFVTNTVRNITFINKEYNKERLEILEELILADEISTSSSENISPIGNPIRLSNRFLYLMTILCKDVKSAYLDEPEQGLSEYERNLFIYIILATFR